MKKGGIIALIVIILIVIIGVVTFVVLNKNKTAITVSEFEKIMEKKGYEIQDATSQMLGYEGYIKKVYIALPKNESYHIEFFEFADEKSAKQFFYYNKSLFEAEKGNVSAETNVELKNYSRYTLSTDGKYMVVSRIDNTAIFIKADEKNKKDVKSALKDLGY